LQNGKIAKKRIFAYNVIQDDVISFFGTLLLIFVLAPVWKMMSLVRQDSKFRLTQTLNILESKEFPLVIYRSIMENSNIDHSLSKIHKSQGERVVLGVRVISMTLSSKAETSAETHMQKTN